MEPKYIQVSCGSGFYNVPNPKYKEPINELETMSKINTQQDAINSVKSGWFIIGSVSATGDVSFSSIPTLQYNAQDARTECKRLATLTPGKLYIFVKLSGGELVPNFTLSI